jgi:hydrogenase maturation protease
LTKSTREPPLIIGYGNPLRGDDAVGPWVASQLGGIAAHQLVPEMAARIASERWVIFVDARTDLAPGRVKLMAVDETDVMSHRASPGLLIKMVHQVYGCAPRATLVGIGAESFELGAPLSPSVQQGAQAALRCIIRMCLSRRFTSPVTAASIPVSRRRAQSAS